MWRMLKQVCGRREDKGADEKRRASEGVEDGVCDHDYLDDKYRWTIFMQSIGRYLPLLR